MSVLRRGNRGPVFYGAVGMAVLLLAVAVAVVGPRAAFHLSSDRYVAELAGAAGIAAGDEVHVAGVPVGRVTSVALAGDHVRVEFRIDEATGLHSDSTVAVKVATVLGTRYLSVDPGSGTPIAAGATIPLDRTAVPYSLGKLAGDANSDIEKLDLSALRSAMGTLRRTTQDPKLVGKAIDGVTGLARMVNNRGAQFDALLQATKSATSDVLSQRGTLVKLLSDARVIAGIVEQRKHVIDKLIHDVHSIANTLRKTLHETNGTLDPLLRDLHALTDALSKRNEAIGKTLQLLAPASRYLAGATGNGPWGDVSGPAGPIPDNLLCVAGLLQGCR